MDATPGRIDKRYDWEEWAMLALQNSGIAEHEVRQVLEAEGRWPRLAFDLIV